VIADNHHCFLTLVCFFFVSFLYFFDVLTKLRKSPLHFYSDMFIYFFNKLIKLTIIFINKYFTFLENKKNESVLLNDSAASHTILRKSFLGVSNRF